MEILEGQDRGKGTEEIFEVTMAEKFPKLMRDSKLQIQKAHKTLRKIHINKSTAMHVIVKMENQKEKILKEDRGEKKTKSPYTYRNKEKNYFRLTFRNQALKNRVV